MFFLAIVATLSSFISCQKEIETPKDDITSSHTVSFVADAPRTKTNATIDGNKVNYSWVKGDEDKFNVYEIVNGRHTPASTVMAILKDGLMEISATFGGEKISDASYQVKQFSILELIQLKQITMKQATTKIQMSLYLK